jgi:hypothetical protein
MRYCQKQFCDIYTDERLDSMYKRAGEIHTVCLPSSLVAARKYHSWPTTIIIGRKGRETLSHPLPLRSGQTTNEIRSPIESNRRNYLRIECDSVVSASGDTQLTPYLFTLRITFSR